MAVTLRIVIWEPEPNGDNIRDILQAEVARTRAGKFDRPTQDMFERLVEYALEGCHVTVRREETEA